MASRTAPAARSGSEQPHRDVPQHSIAARLGAEALGTFVLVFGGVGTAIFAANFPSADDNAVGVGFLGVALAFGLSVMAGIHAVGHVSGGHFNPAVTVGLAVAGRTDWKHVPGYVVAQLVGGAAATSVLAAIAAGGPSGFFAAARAGGFASNGYGAHSPGGFSLVSVLLVEVVLTAIFVAVILSITAKAEYKAVVPLGIGLTLTVVHLVGIPVSNTSVNPARSLAAALYGGPDALGQVWLFFVAPILGAAIAGIVHRALVARASRVD